MEIGESTEEGMGKKEELFIKMEKITKTFPGVKALDECSFDLRPGEVHALLGENGAGKSTLMKILTGIYKKDKGKIEYFGEEKEVNSTIDSQRLGITMIYQELNLIPHLTVAQNIFIGKEIKKKNSMSLDEKKMEQMTSELLKRIHVSISPSMKIFQLTVAQQQMVEIAKAFSYDSRVIIMDEPTTALSNSEIEQLFRLIKDMKEAGISIIYISHRMDEIKRICDRATIMRDGQYVTTVNVADTTIEEIIADMVGRKINYVRDEKNKHQVSEEVILEVEGLKWRNMVKGISFRLRKGEILGFAGLMGAGRTESARAVFGAEKKDAGKIKVRGKEVNIRSPYDAVTHGISYLSEDRKLFGLMLSMSVEDNITISSLDSLSDKLGIIDKEQCRQEAEKYVELLKIKTPDIGKIAGELSGGNQQKIIIAKWLLRDNDILIFDEPTKGIDIGAKEEICNLLLKLAGMGKSIIMISSEMQELMKVCDRIVIMHEGVITGEVNAEETTQEEIMALASSVK